MHQAETQFRKIIIFALVVLSGFTFLYSKYVINGFTHIIEYCRNTASSIQAYIHLDGSGITLAVLSAVSLIGLFLALRAILFMFASHLKINKTTVNQKDKTSPKLRQAIHNTPLKTEQVITLKDTHEYAFTAGYFNQKIYISTCLIESLTQKQIEAVLLHEYYHLSHRHIWLKSSAGVIQGIIFYIPIMTDLIEHLSFYLERAADEFVLSSQGTNQHLKMALARTFKSPKYSRAIPHISGYLLEQRVNALVGDKQLLSYGSFRLISSVLVIVFAFLVYSIAPNILHASNEDDKLNEISDIAICEQDFQAGHSSTFHPMSIPASITPYSF